MVTRTPITPDVLVAMSGGVDSTVCAQLLQEQGHSIMGATMALCVGPETTDKNLPRRCSGTESSNATNSLLESLDSPITSPDIEDAKAVCAQLGVPHCTLDYRALFAERVIDAFCEAYLQALTPNPCVECNTHLKFAALQNVRAELGAHYVATGHYARIRYNKTTGMWELLKALDPQKDQSYFLYRLTQDQLKHTLFPLGDLTKEQVRGLAHTNNFQNANKEESQDICFIPHGDYLSFIREHLGDTRFRALNQEGAIVNTKGTVLGTHNGLAAYTVGQRKGIGVASTDPLFVLKRDPCTNTLIVGGRDELLTECFTLTNVNILSENEAPRKISATFKTSYRQTPTPGIITLHEDASATVKLNSPIVRPAPGQSCVAYLDDVVFCGGVISEEASR